LSGRVVNVGTGVESSLLLLLEVLESLSGRVIERRHEAARIGDIVRSCADVTTLRALVGKTPATPIQQGLLSLLSSMGLGRAGAARA
jgi:nucleoside-diphosphate-sugar epimerase